ncbi:MAG: hypothetical protein EZS28_008550 [Streblomastix strix]|uniref:Uncharacterized protein n=1 Tax=Streblomastix strix TaxID=222440 RepID=A0A5J4WMQ6_9EUKA|nr:MAG: hypothetical protein EZS28_008550 [Streblomastix strix]
MTYICYFPQNLVRKVAFIKLVLVLAVLSLAKISDRHAEKFARFRAGADEGPQPEKNVLYFPIGKVDDKGELLIDYSKLDLEKDLPYTTLKFSKGKVYRSGAKITDTSFYLVPKDGFAALKTSLPLNATEITCNFVSTMHLVGIYAQLGYGINAIKDINLAPSIAYILANYPKKVTWKYPGGEGDETETISTQSCATYDPYYTHYAVHKGGFVAADCIANTGYPADISKCSQEGGKYDKYFEGYKEAFFTGNADTIKEALIKFGAVQLDDGDLVIGWEDSNWITVQELVEGDDEEEEYLYSYALGTTAIDTTKQDLEAFVYASGFTAVRSALGLIAAVLVLPALLL